MKYLKLYEKLKSEKKISKILNKYGISDYTINNGLVDVSTNVNIIRYTSKLPFKFGVVRGNFSCRSIGLETLEGMPISVGGYFDCSNNKLKSLKGIPLKVGGDLYCNYNDVIELMGIDIMGGDLYLTNSPINNIWSLFRDKSKIELFNYMDPIRPPENKGELPICYLVVLNAFLEQIGKEPVTEVTGYNCK